MGLFFSKNIKNKADSTTTQNSPARGKVLAFLNQKGGVGKTTMAFNVAHGLADKGHKVLCIDMDPQSNLSLLCGYEFSDDTDDSQFNIHHLLINSVRELKALHTPVLPHEVIQPGDKLDLIPAGQELSGLELTLAGITTPRQMILKKFIEKNNLLHEYDYVVIDGPPTLGLLVVNIICAANGLLVPFRPDEFSKKGLGHFYETLENIEDMGISEVPEVLAHIPNLVDLRRKQEENDLREIQERLSEELGDIYISKPFFNRAHLVKSLAERKSVYDFNSKEFSPLRGQFDEITNRITTWKEGLESSHPQ